MPVTVCGAGNTAQPVPGYGTIVSAGAAAIEEFLATKGLPRGSAIAVAGLLGGLTYDLLTICGTDPPPAPTMSAQDWVDAFDWAQPQFQIPAMSKVSDWFLNQYWYTVCECVGAVTPTPPAPTLPPPGDQNPGLGTGLPSTPCGGYLDTPWPVPAGSSVRDLLGGTAGAWVPGAQSMTVQVFGVTSANQYQITPTFFDTNGRQLQTEQTKTIFNLNPAATWSVPVPFGSTYLNATVINSGGAFLDTIRFDTAAYCVSGAPGAPIQPCCPPSPELEALLRQILGLVQSIYQSLPTPLHSYAIGTTHPGLSGGGTITLQPSTIAVKVDITTDDSAARTSPGNPTYLFDRGFIVPVALMGPIRGQTRLVYNPQLYQLPQLTEQIGYFFKDSIVATISELTAGP